jgi:hypothetical protein
MESANHNGFGLRQDSCFNSWVSTFSEKRISQAFVMGMKMMPKYFYDVSSYVNANCEQHLSLYQKG